MISRRLILAGAVAAPWLGAAGPDGEFPGLRGKIAAIEKAAGGRLGVAVLDTNSGRSFAWRGDELFSFCSTFKFLLAAAVLQRIDNGTESASRGMAVSKSDLLDHSPVSSRYAGHAPAPVAVLLQAMVEFSDNTAANTMLASIGGPPALTAFVRSLGDRVTRFDRNEPALNEGAPGDPRDTTSPVAMLGDLQHVTLGDVLSPASRALLIGWMKNCQTGKERLRAGLPPGWAVGDKTGTYGPGKANDVAIIWPPGRKPVLITSFLSKSTTGAAQQNLTHANVARAVAAAVLWP